MLIRNSSTVERFIRIRLYFDDGTKKECDLKKGDMGHFVFRRNDRLIREFGRVKDIRDAVQYRMGANKLESVYIVIDSSHTCDSEEYKIQLNDLVDIDLAPPVPVLGPDRGKMSMKIIADKRKGGRRKTWPVFHPRNAKRSKN